MDWLIEYAIWTWAAVYAVASFGFMLLQLTCFVVWSLRKLPPLRTRLQTPAAALERFSQKMLYSALAIFCGGALAPVLLVAIPVIALGVFGVRLLVPRAASEGHAHGAGHPWWPSFATMNWPLRLITVTALAQVLAAAGILWMLKEPITPIVVGIVEGQTIEIDRLVVVATGFFLAAAFGFSLAGAWPSALTRILVLAIFAATSRPFQWGGTTATIWWATAGALTLAIAVTFVPKLRDSLRRQERLVPFGIALALGFAVFYGLTQQAMDAAGTSYAAFLDRQITELAIAMTPVLFLAGTDFAEIGEAAGQQVARLTRWGRQPWVTAAGAIVVSAGTVAAVAWVGDIDVSGLESAGAAAFAFVALLTILAILVTASEKGRLGCLIGRLSGIVLAILAFYALRAFAFHTHPLYLATLAAPYIVALIVGVVVAQSGLQRWSSYRIPFAAMAVAALLMAGTREALNVFWAYRAVPPHAETLHFKVMTFDGTPQASFAIPETWSAEQLETGGVLMGNGGDDYEGGRMVIIAIPLPRAREAGFDREKGLRIAWPELAARMDKTSERFHLTLGTDVSAGGFDWSLSSGTFLEDPRRRYAVRVYARSGENVWWLAVSLAGARYDRYFDALFDVIVAGVRPDLLAKPFIEELPAIDLSRRVTHVGGFGYLPLVFAPIGMILLFVRFWPDTELFRWARQTPTGLPIEVAGLLLITIAATAVFFLPETELLEYWREAEAKTNPLGSLQLVAAGATMVAVLVALFRRKLAAWIDTIRDLIALNVAVLAMFAIYAVYGATIPLGEHNVAIEVSIFLISILWDFLRSGEQITNVDGRLFRRPARIMAYLGYIALIGTMTLFLSAQSVGESGAPIEKVLEGEEIARQGIIWLGTPILLLRFLLRWIESRPEGRHDEVGGRGR